MGGDFFDVPRQRVPVDGGACELPILYRDGSQIAVVFRVDLERARDVVPARAIEPWPLLGRAVVSLHAWEYRDSSIGPYREVSVAVNCRRAGTRPSLRRFLGDDGVHDDHGWWIVSLPVTTDAANDAGRAIWGYPKYVTTITTDFTGGRAHVVLGDELSLTVEPQRGPTLAGQPMVSFSALGGRLLRTRIDVAHRVRWGTGRGARLALRGDGPTARAVRALGLERATPIAAFRVERFRSRLPAGVDVGPALDGG